jgi:hypothetical protein
MYKGNQLKDNIEIVTDVKVSGLQLERTMTVATA